MSQPNKHYRNKLVSDLTTTPYDGDTDTTYGRRVVEGRYVTAELGNLMEHLREQRWFKHLKFGASIVASNMVHVYDPTQLYSLGRLSVKTSYSKYDNKKIIRYVVTSPYVENNKHHPTSTDYFKRASTNIKTTANLAQQFFRSVPHTYVLDRLYDMASTSVSTYVDESYNATIKAADVLCNDMTSTWHTAAVVNSDLYDELVALHNSGYVFKHNNIREQVARLAVVGKEEQVIRDVEVVCTVVYSVEDTLGNQTYTCLSSDTPTKLYRINNNGLAELLKGHTFEVRTYAANDLPDDIGFKVATLSMLTGDDSGGYIDGVGCKVRDNIMCLTTLVE